MKNIVFSEHQEKYFSLIELEPIKETPDGSLKWDPNK